MTLEEFYNNNGEKITLPTFIIPVKYFGIVNELKDNEAGAIFKALFEVAQFPEADTEEYFYGWQKVIFDMMKNDIVADYKKYRRMVLRNRENGKKYKGKK